MTKSNIPSWDDLFMTMAYLVACRSKDESTHIGAVVIGPNKEVRTTGYNSFRVCTSSWNKRYNSSI